MDWIEPDWPAPPGVRALCTTRTGGVSSGPYASLNLADHVGDDPRCVQRNRARLRERLALPAEPHWLRQVHGCSVADVHRNPQGCDADAAVASGPGRVCAVMSADCLPLLLCNRAGTRVAAIHAGWRGLAGGVIEAALARFGGAAGEVLCWLGPAIGPRAFEVGADVRACFRERGSQVTATAFRPTGDGKWLADLYALAGERLRLCRVSGVWGGGLCTHAEPERFFSYRRDGVTGRMASLIWIQPP